MILATIAAAGWAVGYAALCAARPFTPAGKLRAGRRALNAWRRLNNRGSR